MIEKRSRRSFVAAAVAAAVAAPAVAAAAGLVWLSVYSRLAPDAPIFGGPPPRSIAEAITGGAAVEQTFAFIRDGQDPNALLLFRDEDYTGDAAVEVSPLMLAVAARASSAGRMQLS